jgi:biotin carboxyl carrier protein
VTFEIEIGERARHVELEQTAQGWRARVDGREFMVDAARTATGWSLLFGRADTGVDVTGHDPRGGSAGVQSSFDVAIDTRSPVDLGVQVGGSTFDVRVNDPRAYRRRLQGQGGPAGAGVRHVIAPMPGRVIKVLVKTGDRITARQALVVMEAMKMENELRAQADATVRDVPTAEGALVEAGAILVVLE